MRPLFDLGGKKAIVTGAGRGLGRDMALALAAHGAAVCLWSRTAGELEAVAESIRAKGGEAWTQCVDVTDVDALAPAVQASLAQLGRIDILVNNAGTNIPQPTAEVTPQAWDTIYNVNVRGAFFCAQAVGRAMIAQGGGKIINVSSQAGKVALRHRAAYCSSKGAVDQFTRVMAYEWAEHNVHVLGIAPTFVETPMTSGMLKDESFRNYINSNILLGRFAEAEEIALGVVYLASEQSNVSTGHILYVDGGWTIH